MYDSAAFPWAAGVEREWRVVRGELDRVMVRKADLPNVQDITADAASLSRDAGWKIFPLIAYGIRSEPNIALCPETWRIVQAIPGLTTAMFSMLEPGKRLPPHRGPYNGVLRLHLGLLVPEPRERMAIRVGPEHRHWQEGRPDLRRRLRARSLERNRQARVVLFVDFDKPLRFPANLNRLLLGLAVFTPFVREGSDNLRRWERRFHGDWATGVRARWLQSRRFGARSQGVAGIVPRPERPGAGRQVAAVIDEVPGHVESRDRRPSRASAAGRQRRFHVYCARADQIPRVLQEIGRLRELTFRAVGEGTGRCSDIDAFDAVYLHLFVWDAHAPRSPAPTGLGWSTRSSRVTASAASTPTRCSGTGRGCWTR